MMKTLRPVFSPPLDAEDVDEADADVDDDAELPPEDEHAASRTDTMTRPLVSQAVCLSFISESFQFDRLEKSAGAARHRRRSGPGPRGYPLPEPAGQGRRVPAEDGQEQQRAGDD